jgi:DNA-directed RNA polymerase subunit H
MDFETIDVLFRSRKTLLDILKSKGYDTTKYEKFGPFEIEAMAAHDREVTFRMDLEREVEEGVKAPSKCRVEYALPRVKNRLTNFMNKLILSDEGEELIDPATTELVVITLEDIKDTFHTMATQQWMSRSLRVSFFDARTLVCNPLEHVLVPKHERVPPEEHSALMKKYFIKSKANLPIIRFHQDMIGRILGLIPGDIVKITRPSPSAGEYIVYRICVP